MEVPRTRFHRNPSSGSSANTCGQIDMMDPIRASHDKVNVPKYDELFTQTPQKYTELLVIKNL
jgi:hypothetical protein